MGSLVGCFNLINTPHACHSMRFLSSTYQAGKCRGLLPGWYKNPFRVVSQSGDPSSLPAFLPTLFPHRDTAPEQSSGAEERWENPTFSR